MGCHLQLRQTQTLRSLLDSGVVYLSQTQHSCQFCFCQTMRQFFLNEHTLNEHILDTRSEKQIRFQVNWENTQAYLTNWVLAFSIGYHLF